MEPEQGTGVSERHDEFSAFVRAHESRLRQALAAIYGPEQARDAAAEGLAYAWQNWARVRGMENPVGYVYTVARSRGRARRRPPVELPPASPGMPHVEPGLAPGLAALPERQRVAVLLVHGWGWTHQEVADLMGVSVSTVRNHLARGLDSLRARLGVHIDG